MYLDWSIDRPTPLKVHIRILRDIYGPLRNQDDPSTQCRNKHQLDDLTCVYRQTLNIHTKQQRSIDILALNMHLRPIFWSAWLAALTHAGIARANLLPQDDVQAVLGGDSTGPSPAKKPKNVVFILTDDQDAAMDSMSYMPLVQKHLAKKGTTYVNHFTTTAICCPSRVSLWTGKQPHNTNVTDVHPPYGGYPKFVSQGLNDNYLPVWLQEAGYNTYYTGKLFNAHTVSNYDSPFPAAWTSTDFLLDPGTYSYLHPIYQANHDAPVYHHNQHTSDLISSKAQGLLDQAITSEKPFFLGVAPIAPHSDVNPHHDSSSLPLMTEPIPTERHAGLFKDVKIPRTDNFNPDSPSGASWVRKLAQHNASAVEYLDHYYRQRLRALQAVDELVEKLVVQLEDAGVLDDTYVIFSSDNGFHLGQHRLPPGKMCGYEEDIRVPLIIRGPGASEGHVEDAVTTHIDLAPTILKITGSESRPDFDGTPIPLGAEVETESKQKEDGSVQTKRHEHVAVEYWGFALAEGEGAGFDGQGQLVVLNNTYKAVRIIGQGYNLYYSVWCNNEHELYNLEVSQISVKHVQPTHHLFPRRRNVTHILPSTRRTQGSCTIFTQPSPVKKTPNSWERIFPS